MAYAPETTKYLVHLDIHTEGVVDKPDVIGAIFGQTEGLLGDEMDLRDLQRTGRLGRIDVQIASSKGETSGEILITSSLDRVETAILAAALETIDRVGPCLAHVHVNTIEDIRVSKRRQIIERAKELLFEKFDETELNSDELMDLVRENVRIEKLTFIGEGNEKSPAGPHVLDSDAIIVVEGRADVINLLRYGIKNAIAVEGTNIPDIVKELCEKKTTTAFFDGDRGGELILRELMQVADLDYVAICPKEKSVEDLSRKEILRSLRNKVPVEYIRSQSQDQSGLSGFIDEIRSTFEEESSNVIPEDENTSYLKNSLCNPEGVTLPKELEVQVREVTGRNLCRFLSDGYETLDEIAIEELDSSWNTIDSRVRGLLIDGRVNQQVLDRALGKGIDFIVANEFKGIVKRPIAIRLIKTG